MAIGGLTQQMVGQQRNIFRAFGERRYFQVHYVEAVEQVFTKLAAGHHLRQVAVGGGDNPHVDFDIAVAAQRAHLALLQDAQQLHLQRNRHITDLVEKQRTTLSGLE